MIKTIMTVKNISYFSLIIAITTIANASACIKVNIDKKASLASFVSKKQIASDCPVELLTKILSERGIDLGKFKITTQASANEIKICLIAEKSYKGGLISKIFDNKCYEYGNTTLKISDHTPIIINKSISTLDQRVEISQKRLTLLI